MARSSGVGLSEKYIADDKLSVRLDKFDTALQTTFSNAKLAGYIDVTWNTDTSGNKKMKYTILGKTPVEKKANLLNFLKFLNAAAAEHQTVLDKQLGKLGEDGMKFDEEIDKLLKNDKKLDASQLKSELDNIFTEMNSEIITLMADLLVEEKNLKNDVSNNNNSSNNKNRSKKKVVIETGSSVNSSVSISTKVETIVPYDSKTRLNILGEFITKSNEFIKAIPDNKEIKKKLEKYSSEIREGLGSNDHRKVEKYLWKLEEAIEDAVINEHFDKDGDIKNIDELYGNASKYDWTKGSLAMLLEFKNLKTFIDQRDPNFDNADYAVPLSQEQELKNLRDGFLEDRVTVYKNRGESFLGLEKGKSYKNVLERIVKQQGGNLDVSRFKLSSLNMGMSKGLLGLVYFLVNNQKPLGLPLVDGKIQISSKDLRKNYAYKKQKKIVNGKEVSFKGFDLIANDTDNKLRTYGFSGLKMEYYDFKLVSKLLEEIPYEALYQIAQAEHVSMSPTAPQQMYNAQQYMENFDNIEQNSRFVGKDKTKDALVFFLCDYNSDAMLTGSTTKKERKYESGIGDKGVVSGAELYSEIMRASAHYGNSVVVKNIASIIHHGLSPVLMDFDNKAQTPYMQEFVNAITGLMTLATPNDGSKPTFEELKNLFVKYPEAKLYFQEGIKTFVGADMEVTPNLVEVLTGRNDTLANIYTTDAFSEFKIEARHKEAWGNALDQYDDEELSALAHKLGIVKNRATMVDTLAEVGMKHLNTIDLNTRQQIITDPENPLGQDLLKNGFTDISLDVLQTKVFKNKVVKSFVKILSTGIKRDPKTKALNIGYGHGGISKSGRDKLFAGLNLLSFSDSGAAFLSASAEYGRQVNYKSVMSASLLDFKPALYAKIGASGHVFAGHRGKGVDAGFSVLRGTVGVGVEADFLVGLKQTTNQYKYVSHQIFSLEKDQGFDMNDLSKNNILAFLESRVNDANLSDFEGSQNWSGKETEAMQSFLQNNKATLKKDASHVVDFLFHGEKGQTLMDHLDDIQDPTKKKKALEELISALQEGNIGHWETKQREQFRGLKMTGAEAGIDFALLSANSGFSIGGTGFEEGRFKVLGLYVGTTLSYFNSQYLPNAKKHKYVEELRQKGGAEELDLGDTPLANMAESIHRTWNIQDSHNLDADPLALVVDEKTGIIEINYDPSKGPRKFNYKKRLKERAGKAYDVSGDFFNLNELVQIRMHTGNDDVQYIQNPDGTQTLRIGKVEGIHPKSYVDGDSAHYSLVLGKSDSMEGTGLLNPPKLEDIEGFASSPEELGVSHIDELLTAIKIKYPDLTKPNLFDIKLKLKLTAVNYQKGGILSVSVVKKNGVVTGFRIGDFTENTDTTVSKYELQIKLKETIITGGAWSEITKILTNVFDEGSHSVVSDNVNALKNLDNNNNKDDFFDFLEESSGLNDGGDFVDKDEYKKAFDYLKKMSPSIFTGSFSLKEKRAIINEVKGVFATVDKLTKPKLKLLISSGRKEYFATTLKRPNGDGPVGKKYVKYRKEIIDSLGTNPSKEINKNIFGFTAFYRQSKIDTDLDRRIAQKYSMTALGATRVLGNKVEEICDVNNRKNNNVFKDGGQFFENLKRHPLDLKDIVDKLNESIRKSDSSLSGVLTQKNILNALKGKEIAIDDETKVSLDLGYVFYLLAECGNESFGIKLKGVKIRKYTGESDENNYNSVVYGKKKHSVHGTTDSASLNYGMETTVERVTVKGHVKIPQPRKTVPEGTPETEDGITTIETNDGIYTLHTEDGLSYWLSSDGGMMFGLTEDGGIDTSFYSFDGINWYSPEHEGQYGIRENGERVWYDFDPTTGDGGED